MDATRCARAQGAQHIAEKGVHILFICSSCTQPQAKAAVAAPRELSLACCSGEATDMDPASASGRHMLDQPAAQAIASSKQPAADVECGDSLPQPIKGQVVSGGLYDDERRLTSWRHYACLGLVVSILIGLAVGMICVGVIPAQNYQASSDVAFKSAGVKRTYYLSVEEVNWTYTPGGKDKIWAPLYGTYLNHTAPESAILGNFIKGHYVAYTDDTFTVRQGIPGHSHVGRQIQCTAERVCGDRSPAHAGTWTCKATHAGWWQWLAAVVLVVWHSAWSAWQLFAHPGSPLLFVTGQEEHQ